MMIKVNSEVLEFNDIIEIERQAKFFDNKSTTSGDFSYQGELPNTAYNRKILGFPLPDNNTKLTYNKIFCQLLNENGDILYYGFIRIEGIETRIIRFSFFSGNNNWMSLLIDNLTALDFSEYDVDLGSYDLAGYTNCIASSGIVFPLVDNGALVSRSDPRLLVEDLTAGIYVKTVVKKIFDWHGIKIQGELFNDLFYQGLITLTNNKSQEDIDDNSSFVEKTSTQALDPDPITRTKVEYDNDSVYPYFDGANDNFDLTLNRYDAPISMIVKVEATLKYDCSAAYKSIAIILNGITPVTNDDFEVEYTITDDTVSITRENIKLLAGDYLEIFGNSDCANMLSGTLKITPVYLYGISGESLVPRWSQQKYIDNVFKLFNVITSYDAVTATLTVNLFNLIKQKEPIDLSEYISNLKFDYIDFISNYGQQNTLSYNQVDFGEIREYNVRKYFKYGEGIIESNNEFLEKTKALVESDFSNPLSYLNGVFGGMSMEKTDLVTLTEGKTVDASIVDFSGDAQFNITSADKIFNIGDLVRVTDSTDPQYDGDWVVSHIASGWIRLYGVGYITNETASITQLFHRYSSNDDVYILFNIPCYDIDKFANLSIINIVNTGVTGYPVAYFSLLNVGLVINDEYKQSLSFGGIDNQLFYQKTMIDTYWRIVELILNDPVKLICNANLPYKEFVNIDFLRPFSIKAIETSGMYFLNRNSGYIKSSLPCVLELIKL